MMDSLISLPVTTPAVRRASSLATRDPTGYRCPSPPCCIVRSLTRSLLPDGTQTPDDHVSLSRIDFSSTSSRSGRAQSAMYHHLDQQDTHGGADGKSPSDPRRELAISYHTGRRSTRSDGSSSGKSASASASSSPCSAISPASPIQPTTSSDGRSRATPRETPAIRSIRQR